MLALDSEIRCVLPSGGLPVVGSGKVCGRRRRLRAAFVVPLSPAAPQDRREMVDYEKGSAAWDIGIILTRHVTVGPICRKVSSLRSTVDLPAEARLIEARRAKCTCGAGDSEAENTSVK